MLKSDGEYFILDQKDSYSKINVNYSKGYSDISFYNGNAYMFGDTKIEGKQVYTYTLPLSKKHITREEENLFIYPNPADNWISVDHGANPDLKSTISIYSMKGELVYQSDYLRLQKLVVSFLHAGLYFIKLEQFNYSASTTFYKN